jgi:hypothetical protein
MILLDAKGAYGAGQRKFEGALSKSAVLPKIAEEISPVSRKERVKG